MSTVETLNKVLAESYAFYLKTHFFHWNVTGRDFYEYHTFFENIYSEVYGAVDGIAEHIRTEDGIAYGSFVQYESLSGIRGATAVPSSIGEMLSTLYADNDILIASLNEAFAAAQAANKQGLMNFLADRLDQHAKHRWFLKASMDKTSNEARVYVLDPKSL